MTKPEEKLSFSLSSNPKPSLSSSSSPLRNFHDKEEENEDVSFVSQAQFITEFEPSKIVSSKRKLVIPPKPNTWNLHNRHHPLRFELEDPSSASDLQALTSCVLNFRNKDKPPSRSDPVHPSAHASTFVEDISLQRLREDLKNLPDHRGFDEFKGVPVESFGSALLAGYGWLEGTGIGLNAKQDVKVPRFSRQMGTQGLGFVCESQDVVRKPRRGIGYSPNSLLAASKGVFLGEVVRVVDGKHMGLRGVVVEEPASGFEASTVALRLLRSGEEVTVGLDQVAELGSLEEEQCLRKLQELEIGWKANGRDYSSFDYTDTEG